MRDKPRTTPGVREAAVLILDELEHRPLHAEMLLAQWLPRFPDAHRDRALLTQLVNGTLRQRGYLDWLLSHFTRRDLATLDSRLRNTLRLTLFQLEFLERVPPRAAIYEGVELARRFGHEGTASFANGVLREAERRRREVPRPDPRVDPVGAISILRSHPQWLIERWVARWGAEEADALAAAGNRIPPVTLRVNRTRSDRERLRTSLRDEGLHPEPGAHSPDVLLLRENALLVGLRAWRQGWFSVQDEASALVAPALGARPGETVLDLCAGPGGKCAHLAELVGGAGCVIAVDRNRRAIRRVKENAVRLGLANILPVQADGRTLALASRPDHVLVDAPCSGTGVFARRADARWRREAADIPRFRETQLALLEHAADLVRPGGAILYATCTMESEENEEVVDAVLARRPDLRLEAIPAPAAADPPLVDARGFLRLLPHRHGTDGAFAARFRKQGGDDPSSPAA